MVVLIVGDGDFSFTKSLINDIQKQFPFDIVATCYESYDEINDKYSRVSDNIDYIQRNGTKIIAKIDATNLSFNDFDIDFDLIIFNFPHIGGKSNIKSNRELLRKFFRSVQESSVLKSDGLISVSLCQGQAGTKIDREYRKYQDSWKIEEMAAQSNFFLYDIRSFDQARFPDYVPTGFRSQEKRFRADNARTYIFKRASLPIPDRCCSTLIGTVELNNQSFFVARWIRDYLTGSNNLCRSYTDNLVKSMKTRGLLEIDWNYTFESEIDDAYRLVAQSAAVSLSSSDLEGICIDRSSCNRSCHYLPRSPWQQIRQILPSIEANGGVVTQGECFIPSDNDYRSIDYFLITIESQFDSIKFANSIDNDLERILIELGINDEYHVSIVSIDNRSIVAHLEHRQVTRKRFMVSIIDITRLMETNLSICASECVTNMAPLASRESRRVLDAVFPTSCCPVTIDDQLKLIFSSDDEIEGFRLAAWRQQIDSDIERDLSFWWIDCGDIGKGDTDSQHSLLSLINRIDEVCRSEFSVNRGRQRVSLVDDYRHPVSGARGICVRLFLRSGWSPLSRLAIDQLQLNVRQSCEKLFHLILR